MTTSKGDWKPEVTFEQATLVYFRILGEQRPGTSFPTVRSDDGFILRFVRWCAEADIVPAVRGASGAGVWIGAFFPDDAELVRAWLVDQGTTEIGAFSAEDDES